MCTIEAPEPITIKVASLMRALGYENATNPDSLLSNIKTINEIADEGESSPFFYESVIDRRYAAALEVMGRSKTTAEAVVVASSVAFSSIERAMYTCSPYHTPASVICRTFPLIRVFLLKYKEEKQKI